VAEETEVKEYLRVG